MHTAIEELLEAVFCMQSVRYVCDTAIEELLGEVFPMWSMLRLYNEEQLQLRESLEKAVRRGGWWPGN
jgi:hypothetical protein